MTAPKRHAPERTARGISAAGLAGLCADHPQNWPRISAWLEREWQATRDPAAPAKACRVALLLRQPVPDWATEWLGAGLDAVLSGASADLALGVKRGRGQTSVAEGRQQRETYAAAGLVMRVNLDEGTTVEEAAAAAAAVLLRERLTPLDAPTIAKYWHERRLPDPDLRPKEL